MGEKLEAVTKPSGRHPEKRLSAPSVKAAKLGLHADGGGLYLVVDPSGARRWMLRTTVFGRRRDIGLGSTSLVTLAEAREQARRLRKVARDGGDPIAERDRHKNISFTFAEAAAKVHADQIEPNARNAKHCAQWINTLRTYAFPTMGKVPVHAAEQGDVLRVLAPIWTEKPETARRVRQRIRTVFDWSIASGQREKGNPVEGIEKGLAKQRDRAKHFAALSWRELPALMRRIEGIGGMGAMALRFAILTAARSGEVRGATWDEIDFDAAEWRIPASRMKAGRAHRVPLSKAALGVVREARARADRKDELVFHSAKPGRPLSDMTLAAVLKRLDVPVTVHGFRSTFRDWAEETTNFTHEVKEAALAHTVANRVEAAYRRTDLFEKRRDMMDAWASHAAGASAKVVRIGA